MSKTQDKSDSIKKEEFIRLITNNSLNLIPLLKQNITSLSLSQLSQLYDISKLEASAKKMCKNYANELKNFSSMGLGTINQGLQGLGLPKKDISLIGNIFSKTILSGVNEAVNKLLTPKSNGKGFLYSKVLSEFVLKILESIISFKKSIDQCFPGLSDMIIKAASTGITMLASAYIPPLGMALKTTGALKIATNFLKTDNLEQVVGKIKTTLTTMDQEKKLSEAQELFELSEDIGISPELLQKSGINRGVDKIKNKIEKISVARDFIQKITSYIKKQIPNSEKDVEDTFKKIKQEALLDLESNGASKSLIDAFEKKYEKYSMLAEVKLEHSLNKDSFTQIRAMQESVEVMKDGMDQALKDLYKKFPEEKASLSSATKVISQNVQTKLRGNLESVTKVMTKEMRVFAKDHLGLTRANELKIMSSIVKNPNQIQR